MNLDRLYTTNQIGYYLVNGKYFINKYEALLYATKYDSTPTFHWFDSAFNNFDNSLLGKIPLDSLYKERAQQLRDKYDYLILNYSGGCDSWNILKIFLDNNIKLDQVMVCWPFSAVDKGIYTPNNKDKRVTNFMSEWDFATKPDLEWLTKEHPEIKIELIDWAEPFKQQSSIIHDGVFDNLNHFHNLADITRSTMFSKTEEKLINEGKTVATIWGLDKPMICLDGNDVVMRFNDSVTTVAHPAPCNPRGTEYFYWTPDMPIIAFEMAYQTANWFKARAGHMKFMFKSDDNLVSMNKPKFLAKQQINQIAARDSCYTTWLDKNKFQVNKPQSAIRDDKDYWLYSHTELSHHVKDWKSLYYTETLSQISEKLCITHNNVKLGYKSFFTKPYKVTEFEKINL